MTVKETFCYFGWAVDKVKIGKIYKVFVQFCRMQAERVHANAYGLTVEF